MCRLSIGHIHTAWVSLVRGRLSEPIRTSNKIFDLISVALVDVPRQHHRDLFSEEQNLHPRLVLFPVYTTSAVTVMANS
jgi:hypothetical protein